MDENKEKQIVEEVVVVGKKCPNVKCPFFDKPQGTRTICLYCRTELV